MADTGENVAETTLAYDQFRLDPDLQTDDDAEPAPVWEQSQRLRELVDGRARRPPDDARKKLAQAVRDQVRTLDLYTAVDDLAREAVGTRNPRTATLYVILFPGEARDKTGIKDLNDKVLGYFHNSEFMARRRARIASIFTAPPDTTGPRYATVGQDYKTAYVLAVGKKPKDFATDLKTLDAGLREDLIAVLIEARKDERVADKHPEMEKLLRTLKRNPKYRFDFLFGFDSLPVDDAPIDVTFRLVTEALKGAGIARCAVKLSHMGQKPARNLGLRRTGIPKTPPGEDDRGQAYEVRLFLRLARVAGALKEVVTRGPVEGQPFNYLDVYVNTVWTVAFLLIDRLDYVNPTVVRDVRKKLLEKPPLRDGLKFGLESQIKMMELWMVAVNMIDFVSGFVSDEFPKVVNRLHVRARAAVRNLERATDEVDWDQLIPVLTEDVRQSRQRVAAQGTSSQFQFYSAVSDFPDQIFFTTDIRDLGVELLSYYEIVTKNIVDLQRGEAALLEQTLLSNDGTVLRKRFTYDRILAVFFQHYQTLRGKTGAFAAAQTAFGRPVFNSGPLPDFERSVQLMIGGDEFFIGAHPLYTERVSQIIADLDELFFDPTLGDMKLNMRAGVAFSAAKQVSGGGPVDTVRGPGISDAQRREHFKAHDSTMKLCADAPNMLKQFERAQDRIERLIGKLESNPKKKDRAPTFRSKVAALGLLRLYARAKFMHAPVSSPAAYARLRRALRDEDLAGALNTGKFDLIDFDGNEVKGQDLLQRAAALEEAVRVVVRPDNIHVDPIPTLLLSRQADSVRGKIEKIGKELEREQKQPKKP
jgi:hypothetical protein